MSRIIGFIVVLLLFVSGAGAAQTASGYELFYRANAAYKESRYDAAIEQYEKLALSGFKSGNLYYNLGNCYVKQGKLGLAVLNYERAGRYIPADSDLRSNYEYSLSLLNADPRNTAKGFAGVINRMSGGMTADGLTLFLFVLYLLMAAALILNVFMKGLKPVMISLAVLSVIAAIALTIAIKQKIDYYEKGAIVISAGADASFEPRTGATTYFRVSEGSKVEVIEQAGDWYKIKRYDGRIGWVNVDTVGLLREEL